MRRWNELLTAAAEGQKAEARVVRLPVAATA
jgi:hypothetical protein